MSVSKDKYFPRAHYRPLTQGRLVIILNYGVNNKYPIQQYMGATAKQYSNVKNVALNRIWKSNFFLL